MSFSRNKKQQPSPRSPTQAVTRQQSIALPLVTFQWAEAPQRPFTHFHSFLLFSCPLVVCTMCLQMTNRIGRSKKKNVINIPSQVSIPTSPLPSLLPFSTFYSSSLIVLPSPQQQQLPKAHPYSLLVSALANLRARALQPGLRAALWPSDCSPHTRSPALAP